MSLPSPKRSVKSSTETTTTKTKQSTTATTTSILRGETPIRTFSSESATSSICFEEQTLPQIIYGCDPCPFSRWKIRKAEVFVDANNNNNNNNSNHNSNDTATTTATTTKTERDNEPSDEENCNNSTMNNRGVADDELDAIAPVSLKWKSSSSAGGTSDDGEDDDDVTSITMTMEEQQVKQPHMIHIQHLRKLVSSGILVEDDGGADDETPQSHRAVVWRILMGYLPPDISLWKTKLIQQRKIYTELANQMFDDISDALDRSSELRLVRGRGTGGKTNHKGQFLRNEVQPVAMQQHYSNFSLSAVRHANRKVPDKIAQYWKQHKLDERILDRAMKDINPLRIPHALQDNYCYDDDDDNNNLNQNNNLSTSMDENHPMDNCNRSTPCGRNDESSKVLIGQPPHQPQQQPPANAELLLSLLQDFAESAYLLEEIRKDVIRTHPDLSFFLEPYGNLGRRRYAALERILFLWSKFNQGVRYVQGMNEIVGILYYVMAHDANEEWAEWAEADTYWLFHALLMEMSDVFVAGLDDQETGIQGRIQAMQTLLARHDPEVREHLDELGIETSFYAIRWWTTLLSREFLLPDVIRLWDSMFASTHKDNFLRFACATMVMKIRDSLLKSDFATCLRLLHSYPSTNMDDLLESSRALYIYESQVTLACHRGGLTLHQALTTIHSPRALIMAFGFQAGTPPVTRAEQLERAKSSVEASVRGVLGRATKLYNTWYQTDPKKQQELANDKALALGRKDDDDQIPRSRSLDSTDDVYLNAFRSE